MTVAPERSERAANLARRIVKRFGDEELSNDLLELLVLTTDTESDAARAAMREVFANSGMIEDALDGYCQRVSAREQVSAGVDERHEDSPLPSEPSRVKAGVDSGHQAKAH